MALRFDDPSIPASELAHGKPPKAWLIMDGQWGSCGKGLLAGKLALERSPDVAVCNFGPNAGHTFVTPEGRRYMTQQLPTAMVSPDTLLLLGPGSIIDPKILAKEIEAFDGELNISRRLMIHERAAVVESSDIEAEQALVAISSTRKGVGAAQAKKMMRAPSQGARIAAESDELKELATVINDEQYRRMLRAAETIQIESAQGFELSLNHGSHYPYCTSRDATPESILNEVGVPIAWLDQTCVVVRTFPIRVGDERDAQGNLLGTSGPVHDDMKELSWEELSKIAGTPLMERTTVTGKVRRVFSWSDQQFERMLERCAPCSVMLNYANYLNPGAQSPMGLSAESEAFIEKVQGIARRYGSSVRWVGFGPGHHQVFDGPAAPREEPIRASKRRV